VIAACLSQLHLHEAERELLRPFARELKFNDGGIPDDLGSGHSAADALARP
jgi:hypothetical protein